MQYLALSETSNVRRIRHLRVLNRGDRRIHLAGPIFGVGHERVTANTIS